VHSTDGYGWTSLHTASHSGHLEVGKRLLRRGADADDANKVPAKLVSENGKAEVAKFISEYKADANIRNKYAAAEEGKIDVVKSFFRTGSPSRNQPSQCIQPGSVRWSSGEGKYRYRTLAHRMGFTWRVGGIGPRYNQHHCRATA